VLRVMGRKGGFCAKIRIAYWQWWCTIAGWAL